MPKNIILILNFAIILSEISGLLIAYIKFGAENFKYYTFDSNIFILITSVLNVVFLLCNKQGGAFFGYLRYTSVCCITLTFFIVIFVLIPRKLEFKKYLLRGDALFLHTICPILSIVSYVFFEKSSPGNVGFIFLALIPTLIYGAVLIYLTAKKKVTPPYFFLNVSEQPISVSIKWLFIITVINIGLNSLIYFVL